MPTLRELYGNTPAGQPMTGLTANDRSEADVRALQNITGEKGNPLTQQMVMQPDRISLRQHRDRQLYSGQVYANSLADFRRQFHAGEPVSGSTTNEIKKIAEAVSPYYKKYMNSDYITIDTPQWNEIAAQYAAMYNSYGEDKANEYLANLIKDNVASNQSVLEKGWHALVGMGADAVGSIISTAGLFYGLHNSIWGNYEKNPNLNGWQNFWDNVIDNDVTRYGNDVVQYGTLNPEKAKHYGLSELEIMSTTDQANSFLSWNTPFEVIQQGGFTVASMLTGAAYSKAANLAFKGMKRAALSTTNDLNRAKNALTYIQKAQNINNKVIIPGLVGTTEGVVEGLQTKINVQQEGYQAAAAAQRQAVEEEVQRRLQGYTQIINKNDEVPIPKYYDKEGNQVDVESLYNQVWKEMSPKFQESLEQVDYAASRAGIGNFFVNSSINGMLNMTLKAGLQAEPVQKALQNWKLTGWAMPKSSFRITGNAGNVKVKPHMSKATTAWHIAKEPIGEFSEEYLQSLSDSFYNGFADANIHSFIDNKYNGDAQAAVGDVFSGDWGAAWTELGKSLTSKESMKAGVYGALSSIIGTAKIRGYKSNDGKIFGRGTNAKGETESTWEMVQRLTPWRSGLVANIRQANRDMNAATSQAQALQDWLNDPNNRGKFDGLTGSLSWMREMGESGIIGDEYNYRNSALGKAVNDIFMLQKAEGSELYNSIMQQLTDVAYMEPNSKQAQQYVKAIRDNVNTNDPQQTDEEVFNSLKSNAKQILDLMSQVQAESDKIERLVGEIDEDSKQSLIFAQLSLDDWQKRSDQLRGEISKIKIENSVDHSTELSDKQKRIIAKYGSLGVAEKEAENLKKRKAGLEEDIKDLERRKDNLTKQEKAKLKELRATVKSVDKGLDFLKELSTVPENASTTLNEEEIMALDPITRSQMILKGKQAMYAKLYQGKEQVTEEKTGFSEEQQTVIDNLVNRGISQDKDFLGKIVDVGRIESARQRFLKQYNQVLTDQSGMRAYALEAKAQAADAIARQRADEIAGISNYQEFASALDNALDTMSERSKRALIKKLQGNENFETWKEQRKSLESLFITITQNDKFKELDGNSADLFALATTYLYDNSVDLNDENAVFEVLQATDEEGYNKFVSYVNKQNEGIPTNEQVVFTSLEEVYQTYKDVLSQVKYDRAAQERAAKPIKVDNSKQEAPKQAPIPQPPTPQEEEGTPKPTPRVGIFARASQTPEDGFSAEEREGGTIEVESTPLAEAHTAEQEVAKAAEQEQDPIINSFKTNNNQSVTEGAEKALNAIRNTPGSTTEEAKSIAEETLKTLGESGTYNNLEELQGAINERAAQLESTDDDTNILAASTLRRAANSMSNTKPAIFGKKSRFSLYHKNPNPKGGFISTADIAYAKEAFPNSPSVRFYEDNDVERFLSDNDVMSNNPDIFFITDDSLTEKIRQFAQDNNEEYNDGQSPIIAAVKHPNGKYVINGEHYQPIGLMPANDVSWSNGSSHMTRIRNLASGNKGVALVQFEGKPLTTKPVGKGGGVRANPKDINNRTNTNIQTILNNDLTATERSQLESQDKATRRSNPIYQSAKRRFTKNLGVGTLPNGHKMVAYMQSNMKDGGENPIFVFATPMEKTIGRDSDLTLMETLQNGNADDVLNFNSRTKGVLRAVDHFLKGMPSTESGDSETISAIQNSAASLQQGINRYIYLSPRSGFKYVISPISGPQGILNGERIFNLELVNDETGERITLSSFTKNADAKVVAHSIIKNMLMDGGNLRTVDGNPIAQWQVDYKEVENANNGNKEAANNISDWVDDGIIEMPATSLQYDIRFVDIETPFKNDGNLRFPIEANSTNATSPTPIGTPVVGVEQVQSGKTIVDGETGARLQGEATTPINQAVITAQQKVEEIIEGSKVFELSPDGKSYVNTKTGRVYARVTSIITADENGPNRFDENSGWVLPSTNIGTTVDEFVRDFFAGTLKMNSVWEEAKEIYIKSGGPYSELANRVFSLCQKIGIGLYSTTDFIEAVAGDFHLEDKSVRINKNYKSILENQEPDKALGQILLHEAIHSLTTYAINNPEYLVSQEAKDAVIVINACYERLRNTDEFKNNKFGIYGLKNEKEMIAELANPNFREILKKYSLFDKLIDAVKTILNDLFNTNFVTKNESIETSLLKSLDTLINSFDKSVFDKSIESTLALRNLFDNHSSIIRQSDFEKYIEPLFDKAQDGDILKFEVPNHMSYGMQPSGTEKYEVKGVYIKNKNDIVGRFVWQLISSKPSSKDGFRIYEFKVDDANKLALEQYKKDGNSYSSNVQNGPSSINSTYNYPNATSQQWEAFKQQLENLKLQMKANGFHIIPRDVIAAGTLEVLDSENKVYNIDTAGTLDLLVYNDKGEFFVFDMKTVRDPDTIEEKKHKWSQQTSLYQKFLENTYGIKIKGRYIIPIQVSYLSPTRGKYTQGEGTAILTDGKPFEDAKPKLMHTVAVPFYEPHIVYNKLTEQEKELATSITEIAKDKESMQGKPVEAAVKESETPYIDPTIGLAVDTDSLFNRFWDDSMLNGIQAAPTGNVMSPEMAWNNLSEEKRNTLEKRGFSEESYSKIDTKEEIDHIKECLGL